MTKKIFSLCMVFAMMTMLAFVSSCSKEETTQTVDTEVTISYESKGLTGLVFADPEATEANIRKSFIEATNTAQDAGTSPITMADAVKKYFKANLQANLSASDLQTIKSNPVSFTIKVHKKSDKTLLGYTTLTSSEL